jgi:hypothetical protein
MSESKSVEEHSDALEQILQDIEIVFEEEELDQEDLVEETEVPELLGEQNSDLSSAETPSTDTESENIMSKKVTIQGIELEIEDVPQAVDIAEGPLFKKSDRSGVSAEKLNELFDKIASGCRQKYELPKMSLQGTDQLEEVYDLENTIRTTKQHYGKYEMSSILCCLKQQHRKS